MICPEPFNQQIQRLHSSKTANICELSEGNKAILVVNTASNCGFTKQFEGLEALHKKYAEKGLLVLGFPSNSFFQEESSEEATAGICFTNFGVTFPMFSHAKVRGKQAHPVFQYLTENSKKPSWNFNKYLVTGDSVKHFGSRVKPLGSPLEQAVEMALAVKAEPPAAKK